MIGTVSSKSGTHQHAGFVAHLREATMIDAKQLLRKGLLLPPGVILKRREASIIAPYLSMLNIFRT